MAECHSLLSKDWTDSRLEVLMYNIQMLPLSPGSCAGISVLGKAHLSETTV